MAHFIAFSHTDIHEEAVQSYIREGGEVANLLNDVSRGVKVYSVAYISAGHVRSGRLLRSLWWNRSKLEGPLQGVARAGASAKHAIWFHEGTCRGRGRVYRRAPAHGGPQEQESGAYQHRFLRRRCAKASRVGQPQYETAGPRQGSVPR